MKRGTSRRKRLQLRGKRKVESDEDESNDNESSASSTIHVRKTRKRAASKSAGSPTINSPGCNGDSSPANHRAPAAGLYNLGNTCYANSVLQIFRHSRHVPSAIESAISHTSSKHKDNQELLTSLAALMEELATVTQGNQSKLESAVLHRLNKEPRSAMSLVHLPVDTTPNSEAANDSTPSSLSNDGDYDGELIINVDDMTDVVVTPSPAASVRWATPTSVRYTAVHPDAFVGALRKTNTIFAGYHQQDAQEFLKYLIAILQTRESNTTYSLRKRSSSHVPATLSVSELFEGTTVNTIKCLECETESHTQERFCDVSVPVPKEGYTTLANALDQLTTGERLTGSNKYRCDVCRTFTEAEWSLKFAQLPHILCFHVRRFALHTAEKVASSLVVESKLCLEPWCTPSCSERSLEYELFGLICHSGASVSSGHYIAYVKPQATTDIDSQLAEMWLRLDDSDVRYVPKSEVMQLVSPSPPAQPSVYLMFYSLIG